MSMTKDEAIIKARKLLSLSTSTNPNEAALAAAKAAQVMQDYDIEEAALAHDDGEVYEPVEIHVFEDQGIRKKIHWHMTIAVSCAKLFNCYPFWMRETVSREKNKVGIRLVGRKSDVQSAKYLYDMILPQIEDLAERSYNWFIPEGKKTWMHSFRLGCAEVVAYRIGKQRRDRMEELRQQAGISTNRAGALMVLNNRMEKVKEFVNDLELRRGTVPSSNSSNGRLAGREAGNKVHIGTDGKGLNESAMTRKQLNS